MSNTYRHTMKATVLLSGAQLFEALFSLIRAKVIAIMLGPVGIAMNSIFQATLNTIYPFTTFGLSYSAVRDISSAFNNDSDNNRLSVVISAFRRLMMISALITCICLVFFSSLFSKISFGLSDDHTLDFVILAIGGVAIVLSYSNITILQGTQQLTYLAKTTIIASLCSLLSALPLFYFLGYKGISWAVSFGYVITFVINSYYLRKIEMERVILSWSEIFHEASPMIRLGLVIMISTTLMSIFMYFTNVIIRYLGNIEDVGLYQSAYSITNRNFAILSASLIASYYPRLSNMIGNNKDFNSLLSEQGELLLLLVSFMSMLVIVFAKYIVYLLLSAEFIVIVPLVKWIAYSFVFRIIWITLAYVALAKGDKKAYLVYDAILGNGVYFILNMFFYYLWGLTGIGISCAIGTMFISMLLFVAYRRKYNCSYSFNFWRIQIICIFFLTVFMVLQALEIDWLYLCLTIFFVTVFTIYVYRSINSRLQIREFIISKYRKI